MLDICTFMSLQHTMLAFLLPLLLVANEPDSLLVRLGSDARTMMVDGTISTTGAQELSGLPFSAVVVDDTMSMTMNGPFGITAAKVYAAPDSFVAVNYFMREVFDGDPASPDLARRLPFPMSVTDLRMLVRGRVPGDVGRFRREDPRTDGTVLFSARDSVNAEFVLVDTVNNVLRQYQRRKLGVGTVLSIVMTDVRTVSGVAIPHSVDVELPERGETARFRFTSVTINEPVSARLNVSIPASFTRTTFR